MDKEMYRPSLSRRCKRSRQQMRTREESISQDTSHLVQITRSNSNQVVEGKMLDSKLWEGLPPDLLDHILSFLPVDKLIATAIAVSPARWTRIMMSPAFNSDLFAHGKNLCSSYGFVTYRCDVSLRTPPTQRSLVQRRYRGFPLLSAFEHDSVTWRQMPELPFRATASIHITSGSDGLICLFRMDYRSSQRMKPGVWNPLLRSYRWLPYCPAISHLPSSDLVNLHLMVDEATRVYKLLVLVYCPNSIGLLKANVRYLVYDSKSMNWSALQRLPGAYAFDITPYQSRTSVSFKGFVFFLCFDTTILVDVISCYNSDLDSWLQFPLPKVVSDLGYSGYPYCSDQYIKLHSLVALAGKLYVILELQSLFEEPRFLIGSLDLRRNPSETGSVFELVSHIPLIAVLQPPISYKQFWYSYVLDRKSFICGVFHGGHMLEFDVLANTWKRRNVGCADSPKFRDPGLATVNLRFSASWVPA